MAKNTSNQNTTEEIIYAIEALDRRINRPFYDGGVSNETAEKLKAQSTFVKCVLADIQKEQERADSWGVELIPADVNRVIGNQYGSKNYREDVFNALLGIYHTTISGLF